VTHTGFVLNQQVQVTMDKGKGKVLHLGDLKNPVLRGSKVEKERKVKVESEGKETLGKVRLGLGFG
jgi:hypothetical protein